MLNILAEATGQIRCDDLQAIMNVLKAVIQIIKIVIPIALVLMGTIDLGKAVIASKDDEIKKAQTTLLKRVLAGAIIFLLGTVVNLALGLVPGATGECTQISTVTQPLPIVEVQNMMNR